jgi:hypothetical protein
MLMPESKLSRCGCEQRGKRRKSEEDKQIMKGGRGKEEQRMIFAFTCMCVCVSPSRRVNGGRGYNL